MDLALTSRLLTAPLSEGDARIVRATAEALRGAAQTGRTQALLRGKHVAVMCDEADFEPAAVFEQAAQELGARVSRIPVQDLRDAGARDALRVLARLYDAVECEHASADAATALQHALGVPVFNGLAAPGHALMRLRESQDEGERRRLVQAMLVHTVR